jgi:polar amino acid transport system substrate-binding protein
VKFMIITSVVVAMTATFALADGHSVVRMGTEGAYPPLQLHQ